MGRQSQAPEKNSLQETMGGCVTEGVLGTGDGADKRGLNWSGGPTQTPHRDQRPSPRPCPVPPRI
jgi:hypothetical protein